MSSDVTTTGLIPGTWSIDPGHTEVGFTVRHLMSKVRGSFTEVSGTFTTTENPLESTIEVTIAADSITTRNEQRDQHLRSADFFDPEKGGQLHFVSTSVREDGDAYVVTGDLTINGVTKSVDLATEFFGVAVNPWGQTALGAESSVSINRKDFNVNWNMPLDGGKFLVGDKVDITISVEATKN